jgi:predicted RNA-binding Zn-ribbon protein involved in translation (DUF1610 family)
MSTFMVEDVFRCPQCGYHVIEEVQENVTALSLVNAIGEGGDVAYSPTAVDCTDETECRYECFQCGEILVDEDGSPIRTTADLYIYLNTRQPTLSLPPKKEKRNG